MDGVGAAGGGRRKNILKIEVAAVAGRIAHAHGLIGQLHVQGVAIGRAVNGHSGNAELLTGAQDSEGDFASVGDQQFADGHPQRSRPGGEGPTGLQRTVSALTGPGCRRLGAGPGPPGGGPAVGIVALDPARPEPATRMWWNW